MPYQLHCDPPQAEETLLDEVATELFELDEGVLLGVELELTTELFELDEGVLLGVELELTTELATELFELEEVVAVELEVTVVHTLPVTVGVSAVPPFLSPCTPKLTDCPG